MESSVVVKHTRKVMKRVLLNIIFLPENYVSVVNAIVLNLACEEAYIPTTEKSNKWQNTKTHSILLIYSLRVVSEKGQLHAVKLETDYLTLRNIDMKLKISFK